MRCTQCKGDTKVHRTLKNHDYYVVRTRECLRWGHRTKTVEMYSFMPMAQAVEHMRLINRCQQALDNLIKVWTTARDHAARYNMLVR